MELETKYLYEDIPFHQVRNHNELRVIELLPDVLKYYLDYEPDSIGVQDIYALVLNKLQPHYVQASSIDLEDPISDSMIRIAVREAVETVKNRPNG